VPLVLAHGGASPIALFVMLVGAVITLPIALGVTVLFAKLKLPFAPQDFFSGVRFFTSVWFLCTLGCVAILVNLG
jgi:hypothetical protein